MYLNKFCLDFLYPRRVGSRAINCVDSITGIKINVGRQTTCQEGDIHWSSDIHRIVKHFKFFSVSVTVELGCDSRFESVDDFTKFTTENGPTVVVTRWNVRDDVHFLA